MNNRDIMFSIIVPCYNVVSHINETVTSLNEAIESTHSTVEVIFVNDGSTDRTLDVLNAICFNNPLYRVIDQKNGGVSSARNTGIRESIGKYILFLDSDDTYKNNIFTVLSNISFSEDIVFFNYEKIQQNGKTRAYSLPKPYTAKTAMTILKDFFSKKIYLNICALAINREYIIRNDLFFDENIHHCEDIQFIINAIIYSNSFHFISESLFTYNYTPGSAVNSKVDEKHYSKFTAFENIRNIFLKGEEYKEVIPEYDFYVATVYLLFLKMIISNGVVNNEQLNRYIKYSFILKRKMNLPLNIMGFFVLMFKIINCILPVKVKISTLLFILRMNKGV
ncbi:glycosyltransferase [Escherichia albertii]